MKLLLTGAYNYLEEQIDVFKSLGFEIIFVQDERIPLDFDVSDVDAVICNGLFLNNDIRKFKKLKFIQLTSAGTERIPIEYIKTNGIQLHAARGVYSVPIAEWVILKILEIYKKSREFFFFQQQHLWQKQRQLFEIKGKTAAIIGFGNIGQEVAKRLKAFDVKIIAVDNQFPDNNKNLFNNFQYVEQLNNTIKNSDIIILTLPLNAETKYLINKNRLELIKKNAILINVSRGKIIKEVDLIEFLKKDKFLGVALDVFEEEPLITSSPLWDYKNVFITPHNAFISDNIHPRLFELMQKNLEVLISDI